MVEGSQELIFLSFPPSLSLSPTFFAFTLCFVYLGLDLDKKRGQFSWRSLRYAEVKCLKEC